MTAIIVIVAVALGVVCGMALGRRQRVAPTVVAEPVIQDDARCEALDVLASAVILADRTGAVRSRNVVAEQLHRSHSGLLIEEAVERHLRRALHGGDTAETIDFYGPPKQTVVVSAMRLPSGGAVAIVEDVTDRRRLDAMRTDFVANISHELKTPVGAIAVLADALVGEDDSEVVQRLILRMVGEAERATRTIDDLLELSEIEQRSVAEPTSVSVNQLLDGVIERFAHAAEQRGVDLRREPGEPLGIVGDRRQLSSAVGNLVDNAIKYSEDGGAVIVSARGFADRVEIDVRDTGVGIPARDLERIFERFYRVDRARSRDTGGTGLGLAIVRHVVANHGGEVSVSSVEGEGSTFTLHLPAARPASIPPTVSSDITSDEVSAT